MLMTCAMGSNAQNNEGENGPRHAMQGRTSNFNPEEFNKKMQEHIKKGAQLTDDEAAKVMPVYNELNAKKRECNEKMREVKNAIAEGTSESDAQDAISRLASLKEDEARLHRTYYKKMADAVGARKVLNIIKAEDEFHRQMFRMSGRQGRGRGTGRGERQ